MSLLREWNDEQDILLAETVIRYIREGATALEAFEEVAKKLNRTTANCGYRWNSTVRYNYQNAVGLARKQRKLKGDIKMKFAEIKHRYNQSETYFFKTDLDLTRGDTVVCDCANGFQIGTVISVTENPRYLNAHRWIVDKVDVTAHKERMERERRINELKNKLEQRRKQIETVQIYKLLAKEDNEMAALLCELEELTSET